MADPRVSDGSSPPKPPIGRAGRFLLSPTAANPAIPELWYEVASALVERGHQVRLLTYPNLPRDLGGPEVDWWPAGRPRSLRHARFLHRTLVRFPADVIVGHLASVNLCVLVGALRRVPVRVSWYHTLSEAIDVAYPGSSWVLAALRRRKRMVYALSTHLVAVSEAARQDLANRFHVATAKIDVLHNGMRDPRQEDLPEVSADEDFLCPARLDANKGQDVLLDALAILGGKGIRPTVCFLGDGPARSALETKAARLELTRQVRFAGTRRRDEVLAHMTPDRPMILPARAEALGFVVLEAMARSSPVIASAVGGVPELVRDGVEARLVAPDDPAALAAAMAEMLADRELRRRLATAARRRFVERFSLQSRVPGMADWLEARVRPAPRR